MRCRACNKQLNDNESVYKDNETGEYLDMCNGCRRAGYFSFNSLDSEEDLSLIHISEPTRPERIADAGVWV